jgi:uncharacterized protein YndB with AHSA1/START domain
MSTTSQDSSIVKEISINAPAHRVFDAIADPRQRVKWWGIEGKFQVTEMESELREGGAWTMRGHSHGGYPFTFRGIYRVVKRPAKLEFTWKPDSEEPESVVCFELTEENGVTSVRLTHSRLTEELARERYLGWPVLLGLLRSYIQD